MTTPEPERLRARYADMGLSIPDALWPPDLLPGDAEMLSDFWELSTDRQIGMGAGPIPAASIARHTAGMGDDDAAVFRHVMRALDGAYLDHLSQKRAPPPGHERQSAPQASAGNVPFSREAFRAGLGR